MGTSIEIWEKEECHQYQKVRASYLIRTICQPIAHKEFKSSQSDIHSLGATITNVANTTQVKIAVCGHNHSSS